MKITKSQLKQIIKEELESVINEACWDGFKQVGMKSKGGKQVPNCVPIEEALPVGAAVAGAAKGYAAGEVADTVGSAGLEKAKSLTGLSDPETMDKGALIALEKISRLQKRIVKLEKALKRILP